MKVASPAGVFRSGEALGAVYSWDIPTPCAPHIDLIAKLRAPPPSWGGNGEALRPVRCGHRRP